METEFDQEGSKIEQRGTDEYGIEYAVTEAGDRYILYYESDTNYSEWQLVK